jgi:hypothetical protein
VVFFWVLCAINLFALWFILFPSKQAHSLLKFRFCRPPRLVLRCLYDSHRWKDVLDLRPLLA